VAITFTTSIWMDTGFPQRRLGLVYESNGTFLLDFSTTGTGLFMTTSLLPVSHRFDPCNGNPSRRPGGPGGRHQRHVQRFCGDPFRPVHWTKGSLTSQTARWSNVDLVKGGIRLTTRKTAKRGQIKCSGSFASKAPPSFHGYLHHQAPGQQIDLKAITKFYQSMCRFGCERTAQPSIS
jgi:hypothetical protein